MRPALRVSIVAPILARHDAISQAAINTGRALVGAGGAEIRFFTYRCDFAGQSATLVGGVSDLLADPYYQTSNLIVYHFGVFADLFDALIVGARDARQIVRFHNITPVSLVPEHDKETVKLAWEQAHLLKEADLVWADSPVNAEVAHDLGVAEEQVSVLPLCVDSPSIGTLAAKSLEALEILFLGRIVPSKGVLDLLSIAADIASVSDRPLRIRLAGNTEWSPADYLEEVEATIEHRQLTEIVEFLGPIDEQVRAACYKRAHCFVLPSYHEGFCKPVIESLRAGCVPVTYDAHNLANIAGGHGRLVPTGDSVALKDALVDVLDGLQKGEVRTDRGTRGFPAHDAGVAAYVDQFSYQEFERNVVSAIASLNWVPIRAVGDSVT